MASIVLAVSVVVSGLSSGVAAATVPQRNAPVPVASDQADDERTAARAAQTRGSRVEVASRTTETTQVFANPDGSFSLEQSVLPERVRQGGKWVEVDATLVKKADGSVSPRAVAADVSFSAGGSAPLARLTNAGAEVALGWKRPLPTPTLAGDTATYAEVLAGVDLRVRATARGFAHELLVKSRQAAANPELARITFSLHTKGVRMAADAAGNIEGLDASGRRIFHASAPKMWDSAPTGAQLPKSPGAPSVTPRVEPTRVGVELGNGEVSLLPDRAMLDHAGVVYPLVIDPDFSAIAPEHSAWTLVRNSHPNDSHWNLVPRDNDERDAGVARVGHAPGWPSQYLDRSIFRFDTSALKGARINRAQFQIFQMWKHQNTCDAGQVPPVQLWLTGPIGPDTTWARQPHWARLVDEVRSTPKAGQPCGPSWVGMDAFSAAEQAANAGWNDVTLGLKATDGDENSRSDSAWKRFHVKTDGTTRLFPKLFVEFNRTPNAPHGVGTDPVLLPPCRWCGGVAYTGSERINLNAHLSDPDGGQLRAMWEIRHGGFETREQWLASNSVYSTPLDLRGLHDKTVSWNVRGNDGWIDGPMANGPQFNVDVVAPDKAPTVSASLYRADNAWHGGVDVADTFTFSANGVSDIDHFVYGFSDPPTTKVDTNALGGAASVTLTPPRDGPVDLFVQSVDRAGNRSPKSIHHFFVRAGNGPASQWSLDSSAKDDAPLGGRHGTVNGGATWGPGAVGAAIQLDGIDDDISAPNTIATDVSFSVSAWVRVERAGTGSQAALSQDGNRASGFLLQTRDGKWDFTIPGTDADDSGPNTASATASTMVQPGRWTHVAGVYDATQHKAHLYVDGALAASVPYNGNRTAAGEVRIGRAQARGAATSRWAGAIDEVRIYDRALSGAAVRSLVSRDNVQIGHWNFDETEGTTASNSVQGGTAAVLANGAKFILNGANNAAVELDGVDDHITTTGPVLRTDRSFSVSTWVKLSTSVGVHTAVSQDGVVGSGFVLQHRENAWVFGMPSTDGGSTWNAEARSPAAAVQAGTWTHLTGVYDEATKQASLYVNGVLVATGHATATPWSANGKFVIGRAWQNGATHFWPGAIDEVRVSGRALSPEEVRGIVSQDNVTAGLWKLDGNSVDSAGQGRHATLSGVPGWSAGQSSQPSSTDLAVQLDGVDDHLSAPKTVDTSKSFSVAAWVKLDRIGQWPVAVSQDGSHTSSFQLQATPDGKWSFSMFSQDVDGGGTSHVRTTSAGPAQPGVWTHLVGQYDATAKQTHIYVNGVHAGFASHTSAWNSAVGGVQVGRGMWNSRSSDYWPGSVDDVSVYSRLLFEDEIRVRAGRDLTLAHNLRLDETAGSTSADSVGSRTATLRGGASFTAGRVGNGIKLDGVDDHASTTGVDVRLDASFAVSAWAYLTAKDGQVTAVSVDGAQTSKFRLGHIRDHDQSVFGAWVFEMPESDTGSAPVTKAALSTLPTELNTWVHLVGSYDEPNKKLWLYVNGERITDGTLNTPWTGSGGLVIGRGLVAGKATQFWPGSVDDVRVYAGGLDKQRVQSLYDSYSDVGANAPAPKAVPADGLTVRDERGAIYKFVGGAPIWMPACDATCGQPAHIPNWRVDRLDHMNAVPADGTTIRDDRNRVFRFVGGAPILLDNCDIGCGTPVTISSTSVDRLDHMNPVPETGSSAKDQRGQVYVFIGGAPLRVDGCTTQCGTPVQLNNSSVDTYDHMRRTPTNGTVVRVTDTSAIDPAKVWMLAGGAVVGFATEKEFLDTSHTWDQVRRIPEKVFRLLPQRLPDGLVLRAPDAPSPTSVWLVAGGARLEFRTEQEFLDNGHKGTDVVLVPWRALSGLPKYMADGTLVKAPGDSQVWRIKGVQRSATTDTGAVQVIPVRILNSYAVATS
ncbi:LamG-like jellyroll fold domain-containing protein [Allokutzneria oryzae]|uniref:LamG-like jellyroll fold domain-containing protein n=1 Tax=Allokutzneria oryzae TaxID=1378989 RepID=A0ABV5ZXF4_9PSEU